MPTNARDKPKKETWLDWLPGGTPEPPVDELLTRDDLLEGLRRDGVVVREDDLQNWQGAGIVPYGVRRRHPSSRTGRMLYPWWMGHVLRDLRVLQAEGRSLRSIAPILRQRAAGYARQEPGTVWQPSRSASISGSTPTVHVTVPPGIPRDAVMAAIAARLMGATAQPRDAGEAEPERVDITLTMEDGISLTVAMPVDELTLPSKW